MQMPIWFSKTDLSHILLVSPEDSDEELTLVLICLCEV